MSGTFSFLHAADIHLDSPLRGLSRYEGAPAARFRGATRAAFTNLISLAIERAVAFVVIAGDLYDGDWRNFDTGMFFVTQMARLRDAGIACVVLHGNHDAENRITRSLPLPDNVHVFPADRASTITLDTPGVAMHGQSFARPDTTENLVQGYPAPMAGRLNIGVLHTALEGDAAHATYAPCSKAELVAKGYDYWALGHVHRRQVLHERPFIVFPGNLQGRSVRETGAKGATLVHVADGAIMGLEAVALDTVRWAVADVPLGEQGDGAAGYETAVSDGLARLADEAADGRPLAVRLRLVDAPPGLVRRAEAVKAEVRALAAGVARTDIWIEKIEIVPRDLRYTATAAVDDEPARQAIAALLDEMATAPETREQIADMLQGFVRTLPHDVVRDAPGELLADLLIGNETAAYRAARRVADALLDPAAEG